MNRPLLGTILLLGVVPAAGVFASTQQRLMGEEMTEPVLSTGSTFVTTIDVTGLPSRGAIGSGQTTVHWLWVGPYNNIEATGWDVVLQSIVPDSWLSDISVLVTNSANAPFTGFFISPGADDGFPGGPTLYSSDGFQPLSDYGIPPLRALADGYLRLEFYESYVDAPGEIEGRWDSGALMFQMGLPIPPVPSPGWVGIAGCLSVIGVRRRRPLASEGR